MLRHLGPSFRDKNRAVTCGIILQEILQGIRDDKSYTQTKDRLSRLPSLEIDKETYIWFTTGNK